MDSARPFSDVVKWIAGMRRATMRIWFQMSGPMAGDQTLIALAPVRASMSLPTMLSS